MKTALITGATGQDGSYLTEYLLLLGYKVFCGVRRSPVSTQGLERSSWTREVLGNGNCEFLYIDMRDTLSIRLAIKRAWPDEIYNLAGQTFVPISWEDPAGTFDVNVGGLARILEVVDQVKRDARVYQASSSEMFGNKQVACNTETPMNPTSPYGISKLAAHRLVEQYRNRGLFVCAGILFNHESPRRGPEMVTRKIARHVASWAHGSKDILMLGNMSSRRDWGFAGDYVKAMQAMLQLDEADDFVVGTGETHSVQDFFEEACHEFNLNLTEMKGRLEFDSRFLRDAEIFSMCADNTMASLVLNWKPETSFRELVRMMVWSEYDKITKTKERHNGPTKGRATAG